MTQFPDEERHFDSVGKDKGFIWFFRKHFKFWIFDIFQKKDKQDKKDEKNQE